MYKYLANTVFTGKNIVYLPSCHSTNDQARQLIQQKKAPEGLIVITDNQTAGKGQRGNKWESDPGENLTFSLIYYPVFLNPEDSFWLNIIISLSIQKAMENYGISIKIKWPNDLLAGDKKIAGILIENSIEQRRISYSIIGIGLNVNQQEFTFPTATSMFRTTSRPYDLRNILESIGPLIEQYYLQLKNGRYHELRALYLKNLFGINEIRQFEAGGKKIEGIIRGIDNAGRLKVEIAGNTSYFSFKEIKFILE